MSNWATVYAERDPDELFSTRRDGIPKPTGGSWWLEPMTRAQFQAEAQRRFPSLYGAPQRILLGAWPQQDSAA